MEKDKRRGDKNKPMEVDKRHNNIAYCESEVIFGWL